MKKFLTIIFTSLTFLVSSTISLNVFAANGGEGNKIQSDTKEETTTTTYVLALLDPITDTQISTARDERSAVGSSTQSFDEKNDNSSTTISTSTNIGKSTSETGDFSNSIGTEIFEGTNDDRVVSVESSSSDQVETTIVGDQNGVESVVSDGQGEETTTDTTGQTTTTTSTTESETSTTELVVDEVPDTNDNGLLKVLGICGAAMAAGLLMTFGKKED